MLGRHPTHPDHPTPDHGASRSPAHALAATRDRNVLPGAPRSPRMVNSRNVTLRTHVPPRSITRCILVTPPNLAPPKNPGHPRTTKCTLTTWHTPEQHNGCKNAILCSRPLLRRGNMRNMSQLPPTDHPARPLRAHTLAVHNFEIEHGVTAGRHFLLGGRDGRQREEDGTTRAKLRSDQWTNPSHPSG